MSTAEQTSESFKSNHHVSSCQVYNDDDDNLKAGLKNPEKSAEDVYNQVMEDSAFIGGNEGALVPVEDIPWLDMSLVKPGLQLFHDYVASYAASAILTMLTLAVAIKPISTLIFCNDKPLKPEAYFKRFLAKVRGIDKFFNVLLDPEEAKKVFYKTRKMHDQAVKRLEKVANGQPLPEILAVKEEPWMREMAEAVKLDIAQLDNKMSGDNVKLPSQIEENLTWEANLPFSQFGHVYFTTGFFGIVWLKPHLFGMSSRDDVKMKGFIHVWAVIAKMLGLKDEFNVYINPKPEVIDRIVQLVYVDSLKKIDPTVIYLQSVVVDGIQNYFPLITLTAALTLVLRTLGCEKTDNLWKLMTLKDKSVFWIMQGAFYLAANVTFVRVLLNWLFRAFLESLYVKVLDKP